MLSSTTTTNILLHHEFGPCHLHKSIVQQDSLLTRFNYALWSEPLAVDATVTAEAQVLPLALLPAQLASLHQFHQPALKNLDTDKTQFLSSCGPS